LFRGRRSLGSGDRGRTRSVPGERPRGRRSVAGAFRGGEASSSGVGVSSPSVSSPITSLKMSQSAVAAAGSIPPAEPRLSPAGTVTAACGTNRECDGTTASSRAGADARTDRAVAFCEVEVAARAAGGRFRGRWPWRRIGRFSSASGAAPRSVDRGFYSGIRGRELDHPPPSATWRRRAPPCREDPPLRLDNVYHTNMLPLTHFGIQ
jgi:hypothetical protein